MKLGLFKQFVKYMDKERDGFKSITSMFPKISIEKLRAGIFFGTVIDKVCKSHEFFESLDSTERTTFESMISVSRFVLTHNTEVSEFVKFNTAKSMVDGLRLMGANFSPKMHCIMSHFNKVVNNQSCVSDQHGERVHQTMRAFERRYEGKNDISMISDYIWANKK